MKNLFLLSIVFLIATKAIAQLPSYVPVTGLRCWFPFDGDVTNASSNYIQTSFSNITYGADKNANPSSAIIFNNAWLELWNVDLNPEKDFTMSFSMKLNSFSNTMVVLDMNHKDECNGDFQIWQADNFVNLGQCNYGELNQPMVDSSNALNWHNYVLVSKNDTTSVYRDCILVSRHRKLWPNRASVDITLGNGSNYGHMHNKGADMIIDNFGVWNRALTSQEITNLCNEVTVGVKDIKTDEVAIDFQDGQNILRISPGSGLYNTPYAILSSTGQLIVSGNLNSATVEVDMSGYASGMYIVRFPSNTTYFKFIKH